MKLDEVAVILIRKRAKEELDRWCRQRGVSPEAMADAAISELVGLPPAPTPASQLLKFTREDRLIVTRKPYDGDVDCEAARLRSELWERPPFWEKAK